MRISLKLISVVLAAVALSGTGPVQASLPSQSPGERDKDHSAILSGRASILIAEIQMETRELLAEIRKEKADLRPRPYAPGPFAQNHQTSPKTNVQFRSPAKGR